MSETVDYDRVWLPQIVWYCRLIADDRKLNMAFEQSGDKIWTSVVNYDELVEQVLDVPLDIRFSAILSTSASADLKKALAEFLNMFTAFDDAVGRSGRPDLQSREWREIQARAHDVEVLAFVEGVGR
ncbi:hypothetical protein [Aurantiacibacter spongiae]|uniref:Uncharacterized protein n=1 Tax=Aurantiacibacter spongiae TaxID=2488860 RepID=A0A3N5CMR1_9SPHN|nr:hypothetical protein [Aurantiacibacter spongiae]RPF70224.1 hypothetical protein EG799_00205 [Aurantiacibacter spongiae]